METIQNTTPEEFIDYRVLTGVTFPPFRTTLLAIIAGFTQQKVADAINFQPLAELFDKAVEYYKDSGGWRDSEENFASLITPFAGRLNQQQFDQLLSAITRNGQNWDAAETDTLLLGMLNNAKPADLPSPDARARFYQHMRSNHRLAKYNDVITTLQSDGWTLPTQILED